jgi:hypothetical protein
MLPLPFSLFKGKVINMSRKELKRWTEKEIEILNINYNETYERLQKLFPDRSLKSKKHKIVNMNLPRVKEYNRYSSEEDELLKNNSHLPVSETQKLLPNRTLESVIQRYNYLGIEWNKNWDFWSEDELKIIQLYDSVEKMKNNLPNRTHEAIYLKARRMGKKFLDYWTDEEDKILLDNYESKRLIDFIYLLPNRNETAIYTRANKLGLNAFVEGLTPINKLIRFSKEYKMWRESVFSRDNYTCKKCGCYGGKLQAHHIFPFSKFEDLRFEVSNGITLCRECHDSTCEGSFHNVYGTYNNTKEQLEQFIGIKI